MMDGRDYAWGLGQLLKTYFFLLIGAVVVALAAIAVVIGLVIKMWIFPSDQAVAVPATPVAAPMAEIPYPRVSGLCFRTPMGDVGKVIGQDRDMLDMSFRGGVRSTYLFDQVSPADCEVLPKG
jgi:hypothetical protein